MLKKVNEAFVENILGEMALKQKVEGAYGCRFYGAVINPLR